MLLAIEHGKQYRSFNKADKNRYRTKTRKKNKVELSLFGEWLFVYSPNGTFYHNLTQLESGTKNPEYFVSIHNLYFDF